MNENSQELSRIWRKLGFHITPLLGLRFPPWGWTGDPEPHWGQGDPGGSSAQLTPALVSHTESPTPGQGARVDGDTMLTTGLPPLAPRQVTPPQQQLLPGVPLGSPSPHRTPTWRLDLRPGPLSPTPPGGPERCPQTPLPSVPSPRGCARPPAPPRSRPPPTLHGPTLRKQ